MSAKRKNTLVIDFSVLPVRPNVENIAIFLGDKLDLDLGSVKSLQIHTIRNCVLIEMHTIEAAEGIADQHNLKHFIEEENIKIPMYVEDTSTNVRIHDLPPSMPDEVVVDYMEQFGKVKSVAREKWAKYFPGIQNGVRVLRIELVKPVPSYIRIQDSVGTVNYDAQIHTCHNCQRTALPMQKSSAAAEEDGENHQTQQSSVVNIVAGNSMQMQRVQNKRSVSSIQPLAESSVESTPVKKQNRREQQDTLSTDEQTSPNQTEDSRIESEGSVDTDTGHDPPLMALTSI